MRKIVAVAAIAISSMSVHAVEGVTAFGEIGTWSDTGLSATTFRVGADFGKDLLGVKNLGGTAYYLNGSDGDLKLSGLVGGLTYTHPIDKVHLVGRVTFGSYKADVKVCGFGGCVSGSDSTTEIGFGAGVVYPFSNQLSARGFVDFVDGGTIFTGGVGYKF